MAYLEKINNYIKTLREALGNLDVEQVNRFLETLEAARNDGKTIYIFGNGGSASTASHMVCDFNKGLSYGKANRYKFICLNDNTATMMAYANDVGYEVVFVEQLKNFLKPGEVVIGISGSGNSLNVIKAIEYANQVGAVTVGLCGLSGGKLKDIAKIVVHVGQNMQITEDIHMILDHLAYSVLNEEKSVQ